MQYARVCATMLWSPTATPARSLGRLQQGQFSQVLCSYTEPSEEHTSTRNGIVSSGGLYLFETLVLGGISPWAAGVLRYQRVLLCRINVDFGEQLDGPIVPEQGKEGARVHGGGGVIPSRRKQYFLYEINHGLFTAERHPPPHLEGNSPARTVQLQVAVNTSEASTPRAASGVQCGC